ncbi:MAG: hypothetical protein ACRD8Z_15840 [Nitrososphaeraceae archaeon]
MKALKVGKVGAHSTKKISPGSVVLDTSNSLEIGVDHSASGSIDKVV